MRAIEESSKKKLKNEDMPSVPVNQVGAIFSKLKKAKNRGRNFTRMSITEINNNTSLSNGNQIDNTLNCKRPSR